MQYANAAPFGNPLPNPGVGNRVTNPTIPYHGLMPRVDDGLMIIIQGKIQPNAKQFLIQLGCDGVGGQADIALYLSPSISSVGVGPGGKEMLVCNSCERGQWGSEERHAMDVSLKNEEHFECLILVTRQSYRVAFSGKHVCEFRHRISMDRVKSLSLFGDVVIQSIFYKSASPNASSEDKAMGGSRMLGAVGDPYQSSNPAIPNSLPSSNQPYPSGPSPPGALGYPGAPTGSGVPQYPGAQINPGAPTNPGQMFGSQAYPGGLPNLSNPSCVGAQSMGPGAQPFSGAQPTPGSDFYPGANPSSGGLMGGNFSSIPSAPPPNIGPPSITPSPYPSYPASSGYPNPNLANSSFGNPGGSNFSNPGGFGNPYPDYQSPGYPGAPGNPASAAFPNTDGLKQPGGPTLCPGSGPNQGPYPPQVPSDPFRPPGQGSLGFDGMLGGSQPPAGALYPPGAAAGPYPSGPSGGSYPPGASGPTGGFGAYPPSTSSYPSSAPGLYPPDTGAGSFPGAPPPPGLNPSGSYYNQAQTGGPGYPPGYASGSSYPPGPPSYGSYP